MNASVGSNDHERKMVQAWAVQNLFTPIEVKLKAFTASGILKAMILLFVLPMIGLLFGLYKLVTGDNDIGIGFMQISGIGFFIVSVFGALALLIGLFVNRKSIRRMDEKGLETRNGQKHTWDSLKSIHFKRIGKAGGSGSVQKAALRGADAMIFAGSERICAELSFAGGKAIVPPLILDSENIHLLIRSIPAPQSGDV